MRRLRIALGAAMAALVLSLFLCPASDASVCGNHRQRCQQCGHCPCGVPCWARCHQIGCGCQKSGSGQYDCGCPSGYPYCWCCVPGWTRVSDLSNCASGVYACTASDSPPHLPCDYARPGPRPCSDSRWVCAMVCDCCSHRMRFARPWEIPEGYFSLACLGMECWP